MEDIKDYRYKELASYTITNILVLFCMMNDFKFAINEDAKNVAEIINKILGISIFIGIIYVYVFILDSIIDSRLKSVLIYFNQKLPGQVVFSNILSGKYSDIRFTSIEIRNKYRTIYNNMPNEADKKGIRKYALV